MTSVAELGPLASSNTFLPTSKLPVALLPTPVCNEMKIRIQIVKRITMIHCSSLASFDLVSAQNISVHLTYLTNQHYSEFRLLEDPFTFASHVLYCVLW